MYSLIHDFSANFPFYIEIFIKIIMACVLGGLIGIERESVHRPAGFRTHILVCVGSALVMVTSEYIFNHYYRMANIDPARLGAQVISGIGFLGAGTIIRDGVTVKGLTTAASLWAVSCIGLAVGIGFYSGAVITSVVVYIVLITLKNISFGNVDGGIIKNARRHVSLKLEINKNEGNIGAVEKVLHENKVNLRGIKYLRSDDEATVVKLFLIFSSNSQYDDVIEAITDLDGVSRVIEY